jgi:hypothetical protein
MRQSLIVAVVLTAMLVMTAHAGPLLIDFNSTSQDNGAHNQTGYQAYDARHEVAADFITRQYSAFNTTVSFTPTWPDTSDNRVQQMIDRSAGFDSNYVGNMVDLVTDWIGIDARAGSGGNGTTDPTTLLFTLSDLPAGEYSYRSYHHDTEYQSGEFIVDLFDANGSSAIGAFEMTASTPGGNNDNLENPGLGNDPAVLSSTVSFTFWSDGINDVQVQYQAYEIPGNVQQSFLGVNAIEVKAIPEPATLALLALGSIGLLRCRHR